MILFSTYYSKNHVFNHNDKVIFLKINHNNLSIKILAFFLNLIKFK